MTLSPPIPRLPWLAAAMLLGLAPLAHAAERVTLRNGFSFDCVRRVAAGDTLRLFFAPATGSSSGNSPDGNYLDVPSASVVAVESIPDPQPPVPVPAALAPAAPTAVELHELLSRAGAAHHIDVDLLASVVHAESNGRVRAVSRAGAQGLMQLMPGTALALGVTDAFLAEQNVEGGTRYLDQLLTRFHDNIALALAAYNAGPGAVDRFHGVPPFRETRAYVSRIIREFNRRKLTLLAQASPAPTALHQ